MPEFEPTVPPDQVDPASSIVRLDESETIEDDVDGTDEQAADDRARQQAARAAALTLELVGDLPFADVRPPENVLFVCKLNPLTTDADLELIFSRFGPILSCQVIRDKRSGDSLQYAFIEFDRRPDAEQAYAKMQNVLVDDRRIWVDLLVSFLLVFSSTFPPSTDH